MGMTADDQRDAVIREASRIRRELPPDRWRAEIERSAQQLSNETGLHYTEAFLLLGAELGQS